MKRLAGHAWTLTARTIISKAYSLVKLAFVSKLTLISFT